MPLTVEERDQLLAGPHVAVLAVNAGDDRAPLAVPVWYSYRPGGDFLVFTGRASRKARLIEAAGRLSLAVQRTEPTYRYVTAEGPARLTAVTAEEVQEVAGRYVAPEGVEAYVRQALSEGPEMVAVRMTPERWFAADAGTA
ncbi:pyridoxamine 5'-phosphate oxidase [Streptomyces sp. Ru73]|uniref:pyridoxamine 5'-phosphate oxidase family protein n=1 Tax=Streptomyces sp. Ru73 TaxID=2080748 RepID=UPI000CDE4E8F|nr:pyridoxamine 5'-phosphate oxidase family protein [Streptomyces sp. Ru73]POX41509.1 pyridoxamine 5'-phosphate oxidase [Streptomyces sp. Ru73]